MSEEKKLHVDEDWKEQVRREKEQLQSAAGAPSAESSSATSERAAPSGAAASGGGESHDPPLPPASFSMLVTMLATQAMVALGQMPDPVQGKSVVRRNLARHYIDTLSMLETKTKGQLTREENSLLDGALHDLRMAFVQVSKK